ncbi:type III secretion system (T3SS) inner membrane Yop/YscD-like protein [Rathayibacter sp. PhB93]|uniref:FHA domain-containing protein n=1 Tax=Rathayibacter festucae TaxID=110937 RepID=A0ABX6GV08_9MICO|nr:MULTISPECIES: FHA domain-containing protein [Rathayibacter]QHC61265.1 FHA domain-containing protein [Rathayibacter festucae]ROQ03557.1 type III secretion system (T3SS) inner membrane Yop/YscD-like protein [Rathayibacter sp. PhB93]TDQ10582.1 type III secretion system (T3SS) inner membrane Yop/YscD-like protein [Rathayibacter sp. PhB1]
MSELTLFLLRIAFLALLWFFVFGIVYALRSDLFGQRVRKLPAGQQPAAGQDAAPFVTAAQPVVAAAAAPAPAPQPSAPSARRPREERTDSGGVATVHTAQRLVITSGPKRGTELELNGEPLTIGRSSESALVIRDDYTSTHHARLLIWNDEWMIQDLDSTNGTFLDGRRVGAPTKVPLNTPVKVGTTTFELRRS